MLGIICVAAFVSDTCGRYIVRAHVALLHRIASLLFVVQEFVPETGRPERKSESHILPSPVLLEE